MAAITLLASGSVLDDSNSFDVGSLPLAKLAPVVHEHLEARQRWMNTLAQQRRLQEEHSVPDRERKRSDNGRRLEKRQRGCQDWVCVRRMCLSGEMWSETFAVTSPNAKERGAEPGPSQPS